MAAGRWIKPGDRRGKYTVVGRALGGSQKHPRYVVRCDCGRQNNVAGTTLVAARGCKECATVGRPLKYGHHIAADPLYRAWVSMRRRCNAAHDPRNSRYAGRGICVCPEWDEAFEPFRDWSVANGYRPGLSLDRVDVDKGYGPNNCEWVTKSENSRRMAAMYTRVRKASVDQFALSSYLPIEALFGAM